MLLVELDDAVEVSRRTDALPDEQPQARVDRRSGNKRQERRAVMKPTSAWLCRVWRPQGSCLQA